MDAHRHRQPARSGAPDQAQPGAHHATLVRDLAVLAESDEKSERVFTPGGFWLGASTQAMNHLEDKGCTIRNVRTWLAR
jgi:hypothetical protein